MTYLGEADNDRKHLCYTIGRFQELAERGTSLHCQKPHWVLIYNHTWIFMLWIYCMGLKCQTIIVHTELQFFWFTMLNMASSVGQHTIRQMPHDYHNQHQSASITLGSESTVVPLVLKPLIQRQFTYTEDSSEHKLLKTIKGKLRLSEEISDQEPMHICERLWQTPTDQYGQCLHKREILLFCTLLFPAQT